MPTSSDILLYPVRAATGRKVYRTGLTGGNDRIFFATRNASGRKVLFGLEPGSTTLNALGYLCRDAAGRQVGRMPRESCPTESDQIQTWIFSGFTDYWYEPTETTIRYSELNGTYAHASFYFNRLLSVPGGGWYAINFQLLCQTQAPHKVSINQSVGGLTYAIQAVALHSIFAGVFEVQYQELMGPGRIEFRK